ncbi:MAG TPA: M20/M25/M40 family metallo-hydrolase, partial [Candidatus Handelsmanbacteria bacterium]|nr:M20/M25/M40 family metallo-hydrolase [Candidatus Handelsmanbacteria bacterium]
YPPGDTRDICTYITERYARAGYQCQTLSRTDGVDNVVARSGSGAPQLALNCHIDTVDVGTVADWRTDPFQAHIEDGVIYGLGANNCKGSTALHIWLGEEIMRAGGPKQGEIVFSFTGDEERLGRGPSHGEYPWGNAAPSPHTTRFATGSPVSILELPAGAAGEGALHLAGNVAEWVADWYDPGYYTRSPSAGPQGPDLGDFKVIRGGGFHNAMRGALTSASAAQPR